MLVRGEAKITAIGEEDAIGVVSAEEIVALGGIFPGFGSIDGNPTNAIEIELSPAVITGDVALGLGFGQGKADFEAGGNAGGAHHANEERMEVRAIAALRTAGPDGVTAAPTFAGLVVTHGSEDVVVDVAGLGEFGGIAGSMLGSEVRDDAIERDEFVGLEVSLEVRRRGIGGDDLCLRPVKRDPVLQAGGDETHGDIETGVKLRGPGLEDSEGIAVFGFTAQGMRDWAVDLKVLEFLIGVLLGERQPQQHFSLRVLRGGDVDLIGEGEGAGGRGQLVSRKRRGMSRQTERSGDEH